MGKDKDWEFIMMARLSTKEDLKIIREKAKGN